MHAGVRLEQNEMQTDLTEERKGTLTFFFQLYLGRRSPAFPLSLCRILSHKTRGERECDKDERNVAVSHVKAISLQLSVIDFTNHTAVFGFHR